MPLKAAICDDEPEQAGMLERYIKEWAVSSDIKIETRIFPSAEAFRFVWEEEKDWWLILLDIQMEGRTACHWQNICGERMRSCRSFL